jgi:hypothetical protein
MCLPLLLTIAIFISAARAPAANAPSNLEVGLAETDITPKIDPAGKPVYLAGFGHGRKATGVHDPLMARAVVFAHQKQKIAIVSVDLVGFFHANVERVRKQLPGFTYVLVSSTHNHEGPDSLGIWGASPLQSGLDPVYMARVEKQIVKAVQDADANRKVVTAKIGSVKAPALLRDTRLPIVLHDDLVVLHFTEGKEGKSAGLVVQWNCHPETLSSKNTLVSADYVGYTVKHLRDRYRCPVVYLTGTVGGLMTTLGLSVASADGRQLKDGTFEKTERYGLLLGQSAERAVKASKPVTLAPLVAHSRLVDLPLANKGYVVLSTLGVLDRQAYTWTPGKKGVQVEKIDPMKTHAIRTEVAYLRLGELDVACIPGEIYPELVLDKVESPAAAGADFPDAPVEPAIYKQMPGPHRMMIGLANDEIGYIIPRRQWDEKPPYCYGLKQSQYGERNSLGPDTAPLICEAFRKLVQGKK